MIEKWNENEWNEIKYLIEQKNNDADYDDNEYIKIKINPNDALPLNRSLIIFDVVILIKSFFEDGSSYYTQVVLEKNWYKLPWYYWRSLLLNIKLV